MAQATPRRMAMVEQSFVAQKIVPPWSAEARLPQTIRLPVQIANALYGVGSGRREIVIRRPDEPVDALIIRWMRGTPQYRTWFLDDEPKQFGETLQTGEAIDEPREQQGETLHDGDEAELTEPAEPVGEPAEPVGEPVPEPAEGAEPKRQRRKKSADEE